MNGQFVPSVKHIVLQEHITVGMLKVMSFLLLCDTVALKPGYFDHCHLGETTLRTTALYLGSGKTEVSQQSGLTKMAAINFLASKMKQ